MPKELKYDSKDILAELKNHPDGLAIDDLQQHFADGISRRSLQRKLAELIETNAVVSRGKGRGTRYLAGSTKVTTQPETYTEPAVEFQVPLSSESQEILNYVHQPIQRRRPVGYQHRLLEQYTPNESSYLSRQIREHLLTIGKSTEEERPAGTFARNIIDRLLIDLSWASSRLEGNTYTRLDTKNLIEFGELAEGKDRSEAQMILNHKAAIELIVDQAEEIGFNAYTFFNLHALLSDNLLANPREGGRLRERIVEISGTVFYPLGIPQQIEELFNSILKKVDAIYDPFEQAFFLMVHIPYLQPFVDVNKRISRIGANISLIRANLCPVSFVDVPERSYIDGTLGVYEMNRVELLRDVFVWAYERSCERFAVIRESVADPDPIRFRYRNEIAAIVSEIVRSGIVPRMDSVTAIATEIIPEADLEAVSRNAWQDLLDLHEGNVARYRLRLSEFRNWKPLQDAAER